MTFEEHKKEIEFAMKAFNRTALDAMDEGYHVSCIVDLLGKSGRAPIHQVLLSKRIAGKD